MIRELYANILEIKIYNIKYDCIRIFRLYKYNGLLV